ELEALRRAGALAAGGGRAVGAVGVVRAGAQRVLEAGDAAGAEALARIAGQHRAGVGVVGDADGLSRHQRRAVAALRADLPVGEPGHALVGRVAVEADLARARRARELDAVGVGGAERLAGRARLRAGQVAHRAVGALVVDEGEEALVVRIAGRARRQLRLALAARRRRRDAALERITGAVGRRLRRRDHAGGGRRRRIGRAHQAELTRLLGEVGDGREGIFAGVVERRELHADRRTGRLRLARRVGRAVGDEAARRARRL